MSEVKRYRADHRHVVETEFDDAQFVLASDYDAAQSELAALREELASAKQVLEATRDARDAEQYVNAELRVKLTSAEQRNATMSALLREVSESLWQEDDSGDLFERIDAALKPTESGASE